MADTADLEARLHEIAARCCAARPAFALTERQIMALLRTAVEKAPHPAAALAALNAEDLTLAAACARGSPAALAEFDARVLPGAVRAAARLDGASDFADEVAQAVRSRLFTAEPGSQPRIAGYAGRASLDTWTRAVALRSAATLREAYKEERDGVDEKLARLATGESAEFDLIRTQMHGRFRTCFSEALASLPRRSRAVLRLHVVEGVTLDGLAIAYGVHRATVARWLASARSSLLKRTRARLSTLLKLDPVEIDSLIEHARSRLEISINRFLESSSED